MRHPRTYQLLCYAGPALIVFVGGCVGLLLAAAQKWQGVADWVEARFYEAWPIVSGWWFGASAVVLVGVYLAALFYTSSDAPVARSSKPRPQPATEVALERYEAAIREAAAAGLTSPDGTNRFYPPTIRRQKGDRDTELAKAISYALTGEWDKSLADIGYASPFIAALSRKGVRSLETPLVTFRKAAQAGELRVWGRRGPDGLFEAISPSFWEANAIEAEPLISFLPQARTAYVGGGESEDQFYDIMVNRAEVEAVWPHEG